MNIFAAVKNENEEFSQHSRFFARGRGGLRMRKGYALLLIKELRALPIW